GELAATSRDEPLLRAAREKLGQALDLEDFLLFLDDVLRAGDAGRRGEAFSIGSGRARSVGLFVHPNEVFRNRPRVYPYRVDELAVDAPPPQESYEPARDGALLGPEWTMRYRNPTDEAEMYTTLAEKRPGAGFASRIASLVKQIELQGGQVYLTSFLRYRERGYLMWGAFELRRCKGASCVNKAIQRLDRAKAWAPVDIQWRHPEGWTATQEAARRMADAFDVVYATERGARYSNHYDGDGADFVALRLPRRLELWAPDGAQTVFDLSDPDQPRDLSLSPEIIDWVEAHFGFSKLRSDYPHWDDVR
ncbi:MAG: hypothetical protein AAF211_09815, partial [Myxococcota bacterium]